MGLFGGPIDNEKARDFLGNNIQVIINTVDKYIAEECGGKSAITGKSGKDILWSNIAKAQDEIPHFIFFSEIDVPINYPYSDPYVYVSCALFYKYVNTDTSTEAGKKEKKELSKAIQGVKDGKLKEAIYDVMRVYVDNIKTAIIRPRSDDDYDRLQPKETAIRLLATHLSVYPVIFGELAEYDTTWLEEEKAELIRQEEERRKAQGIPRTRRDMK